MSKNDDIKPGIRQTGPLTTINADFMFIHPFKSRPLNEYDNTILLKEEEEFLKSIEKISKIWYDKFPECCSAHKELKSGIANFNKSNFDFIPLQITNNIKFLAHALNLHLGDKDGMTEIKDYIDYLTHSFGMPSVGGHIFKQVLSGLIEGVNLPDKTFSDDERLELLESIEPKVIKNDLNDNDLEKLYLVFNQWVESIPNIGGFIDIKTKLTGKIPLNLFMLEPHFNKYLDSTSFRLKSTDQLIEQLVHLTKESISISLTLVNKEEYNEEKLIYAAEEKLNIQQKVLMSKIDEKSELSYLTIIEEWLSIIVDFYKVVNVVLNKNDSSMILDKLDSVEKKVDNILLNTDDILSHISSISFSDELKKWFRDILEDSDYKQLVEDIKKKDKRNEQLLQKLISEIEKKPISDYEFKDLKKSLNKKGLSVEHKLQFSIPIFLFTKYVVDLKIKNKPKIPNSIKKLKNIVL